MRMNTDRPMQRGLIVVGADFPPATKAVMARAKQLAASTDSALLFAHVVPEAAVVTVPLTPSAATSIPMPAPSAQGAAALKAAAELAEERISSDLAGLDAEAVVRVGRPHEELAAVAETRGAWLLVVGVREGLAPGESLVLGTTAELALRHGSTPVLIARDPDVAPYRHVLLPLEPDDLSLVVLRAVALLAPDAMYDVVHFVPPRGPRNQAAATHRDAVVASLTGLCAAAGLEPSRTRVLSFTADPRKGITRELARRRPDLVAMGSHAKTGLARVAFGSLADHVIHVAVDVDVLAAPREPSHAPARRDRSTASSALNAVD